MAHIANNKISTIVNQQVPFFIREDHPQLVIFLKKYYEYLETHEHNFAKGRPLERLLHHLHNIDIDNTDHSEAADYLFKKFIQDIPVEKVLVDQGILLKHIK